MTRKWIYALTAVAVVTLIMFPLNLLWLGLSPIHALLRSVLFGLPGLLSIWTPKERRPERQPKAPRQLSRPTTIAFKILGVFILVAMFGYDIYTDGVAVGVTNTIGFVLIILTGTVGYKLGYIKL